MIRYTIYSSLLLIVLATTAYSQGVGINLNGAAPNNSSILDVSSTNQGVLVPRIALTSTSDATTIANGNVVSLLVFNTATIADVTPGYYYWNGTAWQTLGGDADADPTNEIELPTGGSNGQVLTTDGLGNYTWTTDADSDATNEIQDLQLSGNNLTITNNGTPTTIDLSTYLDNTDDQNIDSVSLNGNNLTVYIENGTSATVDLSTLSDHDWYEVGGTSQADNINDNIFTQGNVGIGIATPNAQLDVNGNILYSGNASTLFEITSASDNVHLNMIKASTGLTNAQILFDGYGAPVDQGQIRFFTKRDVSNGGTGTLDHAMSIMDGGNIGIGTTTPAYKTHISGTGPTELMIEGTATGYINAGITLKANTSTNYRGTGVFMYDLGGQNEWYAGRPYNNNDTYVIQRNTSLTDHNTVTAALTDGSGNPTTTERFFSIDNEGDALVSGSNPDASAKLEVRSSNKGFLPPRIALTGNNDVTTIASPASGLLVYNTASAGTGSQTIAPGYYYFNGTIWKAIGENSDWYLDNTNSFMGSLALPAGTATSLYTAYVNLQKGVYFVNFYDCLGGASQNYYVQTTAESSTPANFASGFMNYNYNARTDFSHAGFVIYVRQDGTPVRFRVHNPAGGTLTHTSGNCSAFYYYKISE